MANLTTWVGRDTSITIFNARVQILTEIHNLLDQGQVEPHTFTLGAENTLFGQCVLEQLEKFGTEKTFSGTYLDKLRLEYL